MGGLILFLAGGAIALGLLVLALWHGARWLIRAWLNGDDPMAILTIPLLERAKALAADWWKAGLGAVIGAALALPLGQCQGADAERTRQAAKAAEAVAAAHKANAGRIERQAAQREADTATITHAAKGRTDAIQAGPDGPLSGPECRLQRQRLLDLGYAPADLPACR